MTLLLLAGDVEVNPGPGGSSFPCGLCEIDANWSNGGIACKHCDVWYNRDCARLNLSSFTSLHSSMVVCIHPIGLYCVHPRGKTVVFFSNKINEKKHMPIIHIKVLLCISIKHND